MPTKVSLLPSHGDWKIGTTFYLMTRLRRVGFPILEKALGCQSGKRIKKRFTSPKGKGIIYNNKFSRTSTLRKGNGETSVVRPSGFCRGRDEKEVKGLEVERCQAAEIVKTVWVSRNTTGFAILTFYPAT